MFNTSNRKRLGVSVGFCLAATVLIGGCTAPGETPPQNVSVDSGIERPARTEAKAKQQPVQTAPSAKPDAGKVSKPAKPSPAPVPAPKVAAATKASGERPADGTRKSNTHQVAAGQTVGEIAGLYGVDVTSMLAANGLHADSVIVPGQELKISGPPVAPRQAAPVAAPAPPKSKPVAAPAPPKSKPVAAPAAAPAPSVRTIPVVASGGQEMVDRCIGPIHYTPLAHHAVFITEHDACGGWARFSGIAVGETVNVSGFGTYTVTGIGTVPRKGYVSDVVAALGSMPAVVLQTCIPGTMQTRVIGLN